MYGLPIVIVSATEVMPFYSSCNSCFTYEMLEIIINDTNNYIYLIRTIFERETYACATDTI